MKRLTFLLALFCAFPAFADCDFKADTAVTYLLGPLLDQTDGVTAETVTVAQADVRLWKEGGTTFAQKTDATGCTQRENGYQTCPLDTTDTNTEGTLLIATDQTVGGVAIVPVFEKCTVLGAAEYDRKYGATSQLSALDTGLVEGPTTIDGAPTSQTIFSIVDGATNNGAYDDHGICFIGGTEKSCAEIQSYTFATKEITLEAAPAFTIASGDIVRIYQPGMIFKIAATLVGV